MNTLFIAKRHPLRYTLVFSSYHFLLLCWNGQLFYQSGHIGENVTVTRQWPSDCGLTSRGRLVLDVEPRLSVEVISCETNYYWPAGMGLLHTKQFFLSEIAVLDVSYIHGQLAWYTKNLIPALKVLQKKIQSKVASKVFRLQNKIHWLKKFSFEHFSMKMTNRRCRLDYIIILKIIP